MAARALAFVLWCFTQMLSDPASCDLWGVYRDANMPDHWWGCASCRSEDLPRPFLGAVFVRCDADGCQWLVPVPQGAALETCELLARQRANRIASTGATE